MNGEERMSCESVTMSFSELLHEIKSNDIRVYLKDGQLRCQSASEVMTPGLCQVPGNYPLGDDQS